VRVLLDTHYLVWAMTDHVMLPHDIRSTLEDGKVEVLFSAVSIWEIAIKTALKRPDFTVLPAKIMATALQCGFVELPITAAVAATVATLPMHHRDPFDRLLVAQAIAEPARLLTVDAKLERYSELVWLVLA